MTKFCLSSNDSPFRSRCRIAIASSFLLMKSMWRSEFSKLMWRILLCPGMRSILQLAARLAIARIIDCSLPSDLTYRSTSLAQLKFAKRFRSLSTNNLWWAIFSCHRSNIRFITWMEMIELMMPPCFTPRRTGNIRLLCTDLNLVIIYELNECYVLLRNFMES